MDSVPRVVYDATVARFERTIKRIVISFTAIIIVIILCITYSINQYEYDDVVVDSSGGGQAAYMGDDSSGYINEVINGEGNSKAQKKEERQE